jgi:hypothetical protein
MVDQADREPTVQELVGALRETRRSAGRAPLFTVVGGHSSGEGVIAGEARNATHGSTDIANLRNAEIERLLAENSRLNDRIVFLLDVIEREQARPALDAAPEPDRGAIVHDVRAAIEAELWPVLQVLLRLLELQRGRASLSDHPDWIVDLDRETRP